MKHKCFKEQDKNTHAYFTAKVEIWIMHSKNRERIKITMEDSPEHSVEYYTSTIVILRIIIFFIYTIMSITHIQVVT